MRCGECGHEQEWGRFCGRCGAFVPPSDAGAEGAAAAAWSRTGDADARRASNAPPRWLVGIGVSTIAVAVVIALIRVTGGDDQEPTAAEPTTATDVREPTPPGTTEPPVPVFSTVTDAVVIAADGGTGLRAVELDTGASITRQVEQQRPGDQPYRLWGLGSWLVVGWGEIWAVGLDTATEPRLLGEASYFVPAAEPAELWLIDRPDWRGDGGSATWTLVDHTGTRLHRVEAAAGSEVERGVPGGLALRGDDGALHRYDTVTGEIDDLVGGTDARILDVTRDRLLWCEADCGTLQVSDDRRTIQVDADEVTEFLDGWLSADGTRIAAHVAVEVADGGRDFELWIHDLSDEMLVDRVQVQLGEMHAAWTPNGDQLLYRMVAEGGPSTFGRYTASGFDTVDHDPLEGLRPARFLVGRADWHPEFFGHEVDRPSDSR